MRIHKNLCAAAMAAAYLAVGADNATAMTVSGSLTGPTSAYAGDTKYYVYTYQINTFGSFVSGAGNLTFTVNDIFNYQYQMPSNASGIVFLSSFFPSAGIYNLKVAGSYNANHQYYGFTGMRTVRYQCGFSTCFRQEPTYGTVNSNDTRTFSSILNVTAAAVSQPVDDDPPSAVPVPGALPLLASALIGFGVIARRKRKASAPA